MKLSIGSDHAGFQLKETLKKLIKQKGYGIIDVGTDSNESCDYPDIAHPLAENVIKEGNFGIGICGSGNGINMALNKHNGIRAALCWNVKIAKLARQHNDANVLVLPARFIDAVVAMNCVEIFLESDFEGGRHARRVNKIPI